MKKTTRTYKKNNGITIISLSITILVLVIISAVSIGAMYDGGMVEQAEKVENKTNIKILEKQIKQDILTEQLNTGNITKEKINTILSKYNAELSESETIIIKNGKYEISLDDVYKGEILNFWQKKGVTSEYVKFDVLYCGIVDLYGDPNTAMHFGLYSNGDLCFNISDTLDNNFPIKDADGNNNVGNQGQRKENVETLLSVSKILPNGYTAQLGNIGYHTIRYTDNNTVEVYFVDNDSASAVLVDGHIPESSEYLVGTLLEQ